MRWGSKSVKLIDGPEVSREAALDERCPDPECQAEPGDDCCDAGGSMDYDVHIARYQAAAEAAGSSHDQRSRWL